MYKTLLLELGNCPGSADRKSNEKGKSDSFFLKGPDGKLQYVMKPMQGESLTSSDWEPGGGPVREILSSRLNDIIAGQTGGFDCRGLKTELVSLEDPCLANGVLSQSTTRVGSLQSAAPGGGATAESLFHSLNDRQPATIKAFKEQFNEDDCQAIALRHFLTFDQDAHCGNIMVDKQGDGPGQTRLIPIDAGQSLPSPEAAKRNAAALRLGGTPTPNSLNDKELLLLQLPAAMKPFSGAALAAIGKLDPDKLASDLKTANDALVQQEPSMAGKVDPGAFDLVRKSAKFLKLAAQNGLTLYEISMVYGEGFAPVIDADSQSEDAALQNALQTALNLKQRNGGFGGIELELVQLGFTNGKTGEINELRLDQKERILKNGWTKAQWDQQYEQDLRTKELADIGKYFDPSAPESSQFTTLIANGFQGKSIAFLKLLSDHRRKGGDPQVAKELRGNDATLALELKQPVEKKMGAVIGGFNLWENILYLQEVGGVERLLATIDASFLGQPLKDQLAAFKAAEQLRKARKAYEQEGGDKLLRELGESFITQFPTIDANYQRELDEWKKTQAGEQPADPFNSNQRKLPTTKSDLDKLLGMNEVKKHDSLKTLRSYFKKKS